MRESVYSNLALGTWFLKDSAKKIVIGRSPLLFVDGYDMKCLHVHQD